MMLPKDLLADLETGDRTNDHLENKETVTSSISVEQFQGLQNALNQTNLGQLFQYRPGVAGTSNTLGGITQWYR